MEHFLINSSLCLFSLWLFYKVALENTSWHRFKRYYLLGAVVVSATIPFLVVRTIFVPFQANSQLTFTPIEIIEVSEASQGLELEWSTIILVIYLLGVLLMAFRLVRNLNGLRLKSTDELESYKGYGLVLRKLLEIPHSFYNKIYASSTDYKSGDIPEVVLEHEKAHLDQRHSMDILVLEFLIVILWFNPLLYLMKYSIKLNHEFLADQAVISTGTNTKQYQTTLLAFTAGSSHRALTNTFNFPLIKKRFTIMKTHTTTASGLLRSLAIIPVLALLIISCGQEEVIVEPEVIEIVEVPIDQAKAIYIETDLNSGEIYVEGIEYRFTKNDLNEVTFYNKKGKEVDLENLGYSIILTEMEIEEVIIEESELFRGKKISDTKKIVSPINNDFTYDLKSNSVIESGIGELKKRYGNDLIIISEMAETNGNSYYYSTDVPEKLFLNKYFEVVDLRRLSNGKINVSKFVLPPPPPPLSPLEFIKANREDLDYYIDDKKVSRQAAVSTIKMTGETGVKILKNADGTQSVKIIMTDEKRKMLPPPPPPRPEIIEVEKSLEQALRSSTSSVKNEVAGTLYAMNTTQRQDASYATQQMMDEYKKLIQQSYRGKDRVWKNSDLEKMKRIFAQMSPSQKSSVEKLPAVLSIDLKDIKPKPIQPSQKQFEALKNKSEYAVWIDGKVIDNNILKQYTYTDFAHFNMSKVYKNARSKKFPQPFQVSLYTTDGFERSFRNPVKLN